MNCRPKIEEVEAEISAGRMRSLVIELFPESEGYSLTLPGKNCADCVTRKFSYSESDLLECLDRREIPYFLADLLELCPISVYFRGCLPVEIRDFRIGKGRRTLILLRPSLQSLTSDLNGLVEAASAIWTENGKKFSAKDRWEMEVKFWKLVSPPLSLDSPVGTGRSVSAAMDSYSVRKLFRRFKRRNIEKRKRQGELAMKSCRDFGLMNRILNGEIRLKSAGASEGEETESETAVTPSPSSVVSVLKEAREISLKKCAWNSNHPKTSLGGQWRKMLPSTKKPWELADRRASAIRQKLFQQPEERFENLLHRVEEITVEMAGIQNAAPVSCGELGGEQQGVGEGVIQATSIKTRIVISKHNRDGTYWGQLFVENPPISSGPFCLGLESDYRAYEYQYLDMVTEGGRRQPISVVRYGVGKPPQDLLSPRNSR